MSSAHVPDQTVIDLPAHTIAIQTIPIQTIAMIEATISNG